MSVSLWLCYFFTKIRHIWGYLHFWMRCLSEIFLRHSWDIGSIVFNLLVWAYILTYEFLCAGLNFETFDLVTFWFPGSASETSGLVVLNMAKDEKYIKTDNIMNTILLYSKLFDYNIFNLNFAVTPLMKYMNINMNT